MRTSLPIGILTLCAASLFAAETTPLDQVNAAAKKLAEKSSYSWKETYTVPEDAPFKPEPSEGKTEKGGITSFTLSFGDNTTRIFLKGDKSAINGPDGDWRSAKDMGEEEGPGRFLSRLVQSFKAPAGRAGELAAAARELKREGDAFTSDMTDEGAKAQFRFGPATNARGSVKFWVKDGLLTKYQFRIAGKVEFGGNEMDVDRTTLVEITEVGTTKVDVPAEARKLLDPAPETKPAPTAPAK